MRTLIVPIVALLISACGPNLNTPSSTTLTGKWQSSDTVSFFFAIKMDITQTQAGDVTGGWTSLYKGGNLSCPEGSICPASNEVGGRHTVVGVSMEILGIGRFTGQLVGNNVLRGDIYRYDGDFNVMFKKVP